MEAWDFDKLMPALFLVAVLAFAAGSYMGIERNKERTQIQSEECRDAGGFPVVNSDRTEMIACEFPRGECEGSQGGRLGVE